MLFTTLVANNALAFIVWHNSLLLPDALEFLGRLFDGHELAADLVALGHGLGQRVIQLGPLLHRTLMPTGLLNAILASQIDANWNF